MTTKTPGAKTSKQLICAFILIIALITGFSSRSQSFVALMVSITPVPATPKMCTCQLVQLRSKDYSTKTVGIFAEKEQKGNVKAGYRLMDAMIRKEKVYLENDFSDKVIPLDKYTSDTDCMALYHQLKQQDKIFAMYDILNVDILLNIAKR